MNMGKGQLMHLGLFLISQTHKTCHNNNSLTKAAGAHVYALLRDLSGPGRTRTSKGCCVLCKKRWTHSLQVTHSAQPVAHGSRLVSFSMRIGLAMWSAEHSISSGDSPKNSGLLYGNFSGISEPPPGWSPLEPPAIIPPIKLATADFTRVSMVLLQRGSRRCDCVSFPPPDRSQHGDAVSRRERQTHSGRKNSFSPALPR